MFAEDSYIGCPCGVQGLVALSDSLNAQVVDQVNETQELVMINNFALETDEYQYKKVLQERISEIASWRWVLSDLAQRLEEAIATLHHEHKALRAVVQRIRKELITYSSDGTRPGALCPLTDSVEEAIKQKNRFEKMIPELEKQIVSAEKTKKRIEDDVLHKEEAINVEENCAKIDLSGIGRKRCKKKKKIKCSPIPRWENRCASLKKDGLRALRNAIVTRQQVRGARVRLSISAQSFAAKVDSALRRRLHANQVKVQELAWQREEAIRDLSSLDEELRTTEMGVIENMEQERLVEARLADRNLRPPGELTKDDVDKKLRNELARLRQFNKKMRNNIDRITSLQNTLKEVIIRIDNCAEDIIQVVRLDEERIRSRVGEDLGSASHECPSTPVASTSSSVVRLNKTSGGSNSQLNTIIEENEEVDDYPFDN